MARITAIVVLTAAAGCAAGPRPLHFPARAMPAAVTAESDEALVAKGYVSLGPLETAVEKQRCRDTRQPSRRCEAINANTDSLGLLLANAGKRGGDLVRVARARDAATVPWTARGCEPRNPPARVVDRPDGGWSLLPRPEIICSDTWTETVGIKQLDVSSGTVWRHDPSLVPTMRLAVAIETGDDGAVATTLVDIRNVDVYLTEPPLVVAARTGHPAIVRRLLAAGARAGASQALLTAVGRSDLTVTEALLAAGISPDAQDPSTGQRALHVAAHRDGTAPLLRSLLGAGAQVDALDSASHSPLQSALLGCNRPAATVLLSAGANARWALADQEVLATARDRCPKELSEMVHLMSRR